MISHVFKPRRKNKAGKSVASRLYRGRYRLEGEFSTTEVPLGTGDKQVAEKKLAMIVAEKERERAGILAPALERNAARQNLEEHLSDFVADLEAQGRSDDYRSRIASRSKRLFKECRWSFLKDMSAGDFVAWRSQQRNTAAKTLNDYLDAVNGLANWCMKTGRATANPFVTVSKVEVRGKQQERRALTDDELGRLVEAAPQRRLLYLTAAYTGLRVNEIRQLKVPDAHLSSETAYFEVRSSTTKNKRKAIVPIHSGLLQELRDLLAGKGQDEPIFELPKRPNETINWDFKRAGIPKVDTLGRKVDFHALRNTFATKLARSGVSQRLAQELMRHSDPRLTAQIYTDASQLPTFSAVEGLDWNMGTSCRERSLDNPQIAPLKSASSGHETSRTGEQSCWSDSLEALGQEGIDTKLPLPVAKQEAAEMVPRRGFEPLSHG